MIFLVYTKSLFIKLLQCFVQTVLTVTFFINFFGALFKNVRIQYNLTGQGELVLVIQGIKNAYTPTEKSPPYNIVE